MSSSFKLSGSYILVAGSISNSTDNQRIDVAHAFVETFVEEVLEADGGFVAYFATEVFNNDNKPVLFDWTVARAIDRLIPNESNEIRLKIIASDDRLKIKASPDQRKLLKGMIARGVAELIPLEEEILTGGNIGEEQTEHATAMVALGGGKGVLDRAYKMAKKLRPVIPLDLQLGANSEDGAGALGILRRFQIEPEKYMPYSGGKVVRILSSLSLEEQVLEPSQIAKRMVDILYAEEQARRAALPPDVLVLTAIYPELAAAKQAFRIAEDAPPKLTNTGLHTWNATVTSSNGKTVSCVVACFAGPGNVDAAVITATLLNELNPSNVVMLGIAGGMREKCALGDVVFADRIVAYEGAALLEGGGAQARPESIRLSLRVRQDIGSYLSNQSSLKQRLITSYENLNIVFPKEAEEGAVTKDILPKTTTVGSGEKLIRDPDKFKALRELNGRTEVVEMEGHGVFAACDTHRKDVLMIRGISDFGDGTKNNDFHHLAAAAAAAVTVDFIAYGLTL